MADKPDGPLKGETGPKATTAASRMNTKRRRDYTAELLAEGKTVRQIAAATGVSVSTAHADVQTLLKALPPVDLTEQRALALSRLDHLEERLVARLGDFEYELFNAQGDTVEVKGPMERTVQELLKIEERRAKLLGLDAPTQIKAEVQQVRVVVEGADGV